MAMLISLTLFMLLFAAANGLCLHNHWCCNTTTDMKSYQRNETINVSFFCIDASIRSLYDASPTMTGDGTPISYDYSARIVPVNMEYDPYEINTRVLRSIPYFGDRPKSFGATALFYANESHHYGQHKVFIAEHLLQRGIPSPYYKPNLTSTLIDISEPFEIMGQKRTTFLGRMLDRVVRFWNWLRSLFGK